MGAMVSQTRASRLLSHPFIQAQIKETSKIRVTGLCVGNSPVTGEFPAQMASNTKKFHFMTSSCGFRSLSHVSSELWMLARLKFYCAEVSWYLPFHYIDVIMTTIASQITSLMVVYSTVYSDADQSKHQRSASLAFVWGIHRDRWIPRTKGQLRGQCFHLMTSSCSSAPLVTVVRPL